jgi:hypothetical protein
LRMAAWRSHDRPVDNAARCPQGPTTATMTQIAEDSGHNFFFLHLSPAGMPQNAGLCGHSSEPWGPA